MFQGHLGGQVRDSLSHLSLSSASSKAFTLQLWVAYAPCGSQHKDAVQVTLEQIDLIKRFINQYPNHLKFVNDSTGIIFCKAVISLCYFDLSHHSCAGGSCRRQDCQLDLCGIRSCHWHKFGGSANVSPLRCHFSDSDSQL